MLVDLKIRPPLRGFVYLYEAERNPPVMRPHRHPELELNVICGGWITYLIGEERRTFPVGTVAWLYPMNEHQLISRSADARYFVAVFGKELLGEPRLDPIYEALPRSGAEEEEVLTAKLRFDDFDLLRRNLQNLAEGGGDPDVLNRELGFGAESDFTYRHAEPEVLNAGLSYLLAWAWRATLEGARHEAPVAVHASVRKAVRLLNEGQTGISVEQLARRCGASPSYLSRLFHKQVGIPLSRYRNSLRLSRFLELYGRGAERSMLEAALESGFGSYAQFYKVFSTEYGEGPSKLLHEGG